MLPRARCHRSQEMRAIAIFWVDVPVIALNGAAAGPTCFLHKYAHLHGGGRATLRPNRGQLCTLRTRM